MRKLSAASRQFEALKSLRGWRARARVSLPNLVVFGVLWGLGALAHSPVVTGVGWAWLAASGLVLTVAFFERPFTLVLGFVVLGFGIAGAVAYAWMLLLAMRSPLGAATAGMRPGMLALTVAVFALIAFYGARLIARAWSSDAAASSEGR